MRYAIVYLPENKLCEAYDSGMQYDLYATRQGAERTIRENLAAWSEDYAVAPVPTYGDLTCDPVFNSPSLFEHPEFDHDHYHETGEFRLTSGYGDRIVLLPEDDA